MRRDLKVEMIGIWNIGIIEKIPDLDSRMEEDTKPQKESNAQLTGGVKRTTVGNKKC